jgi:dUTP pyrophosphatase
MSASDGTGAMQLKVKRLDPRAILPSYAHEGDAGLDLFALERSVLPTGASTLVRTGVAVELPRDTEAQVRPRSGLALRHGVTVLNTPGTIDEGYRGEVGVILINHGRQEFVVEPGMKIAQLVVSPRIAVKIAEVQELVDTVRGAGGFGSTGS